MSESCATNPQSCESERPPCERHYRPNVDIFDRADEIVILADLPGASQETIQVDYEEGELSIEARVEPRQDTEARFLVREYGTGDFRRTFRVSEVVDAEQISASYSEGVLTVHLPKVQAAKPHRVAINSN